MKTYGQLIDELTEEMRKHGTMGFYILQCALKKLAETSPIALVEINRTLVQETPGYKRAIDIRDGADQQEALHNLHQFGIKPDEFNQFGIFDQ